jgi:hypothetical protein
MRINNAEHLFSGRVNDGYTPKGYVTQVVQGKSVQIPVSKLKIIPPKSGTAAVIIKK